MAKASRYTQSGRQDRRFNTDGTTFGSWPWFMQIRKILIILIFMCGYGIYDEFTDPDKGDLLIPAIEWTVGLTLFYILIKIYDRYKEKQGTIEKTRKVIMAMQGDAKLKRYEKEFEKSTKDLENAVQKRRKEDPGFAHYYDKWSKIYD